MEYSVTWGGDPEDLCFTTSGVGRVLDVRAMFREARADPHWRDGLNVLVDHTRTNWGSISSDEMSALTQMHKEIGPTFGAQRMAFAVRDAASFHTERLVALSLDREVPWIGHVFDSVADARQWLREPPDRILPHVLPRWESERATSSVAGRPPQR